MKGGVQSVSGKRAYGGVVEWYFAQCIQEEKEKRDKKKVVSFRLFKLVNGPQLQSHPGVFV